MVARRGEGESSEVEGNKGEETGRQREVRKREGKADVRWSVNYDLYRLIKMILHRITVNMEKKQCLKSIFYRTYYKYHPETTTAPNTSRDKCHPYASGDKCHPDVSGDNRQPDASGDKRHLDAYREKHHLDMSEDKRDQDAPGDTHHLEINTTQTHPEKNTVWTRLEQTPPRDTYSVRTCPEKTTIWSIK